MPTAVDMQALFNADGVVELRRRGAPTALWSCGDAEERAMGRARSAARRRAAGAVGGALALRHEHGGGLARWRPGQAAAAWPVAAGLARTAGASIFFIFLNRLLGAGDGMIRP